MEFKVYIISDSEAINFMIQDDIEGFKKYLSEEDFLYFAEPEVFDSEKAALAFCARIGSGIDERIVPAKYPLLSFEKTDIPFIEAIENY